LGLVGIIQEGNKTCPVDSRVGGFITLEFRLPIESIRKISFLDIDGLLTPDLNITYDGGKTVVLDTPATGENGYLSLPLDSKVYRDVTMIDIKTFGAGAFKSLEYQYCPRKPKTRLLLKKYAGPPGMCSEDGITTSSMQDNIFSVASAMTNFIYCYVISVPTTSQECLYDIVLNDPARIGGTNGPQVITQRHELLCPGQKLFISGNVSRLRKVASEGMVVATVEGYGQYSGNRRMSQDGAGVFPSNGF